MLSEALSEAPIEPPADAPRTGRTIAGALVLDLAEAVHARRRVEPGYRSRHDGDGAMLTVPCPAERLEELALHLPGFPYGVGIVAPRGLRDACLAVAERARALAADPYGDPRPDAASGRSK